MKIEKIKHAAVKAENGMILHGLYYTYTKLKCRCEFCSAAGRDYRNKYRGKK